MKVFGPNVCIFFVLFTIFAFYNENKFKLKLQKKNLPEICILSYIVGGVHDYVNVFLYNSLQRVTVTQTESNKEVKNRLISTLLSNQKLCVAT